MTNEKQLWQYLEEHPFPISEITLNQAWDWLVVCVEYAIGNRPERVQDIVRVMRGLPVDGKIIPGIGWQEISFDLIEADIYPERGYTETMLEVSLSTHTVIVPAAAFAEHLEQVLDSYRQQSNQ